MLTATRARRAAAKAGEPIPLPYTQWTDNGLHIRRGQFSVIAAAPGVGKSALALDIALSAKVPTLYLSADSSSSTTYMRAAAIVSGDSQKTVEAAMIADGMKPPGDNSPDLCAEYDALIDAERHLRLSYDAALYPADIDEELEAFGAVFGEWPHLLVLDNLRNLYTDDDAQGHYATEHVSNYLHETARDSNAAVLALHHVTGQYSNGTSTVPLNGLMEQVHRVPEVVVTLHRRGMPMGGMQVLGASPVKNRDGEADPSGSRYFEMHVNFGHMKVTG